MSNAVPSPSQRKPIIRWILIVVLAIAVAVSAIPNYLEGQWPWNSPPKVPQLDQLRALKETPLTLPGWRVSTQQEIDISGNAWNLAEYQTTALSADGLSTLALLLRPQPDHDQQPEVEWVDITGTQGWQVNDLHRVRFPSQVGQSVSISVTARYFRALAESSTLAVMQWYAWPMAGHPTPGRWFWADQMRQWRHRERMPWVAVSIVVPIEPVGDIRTHTDAMIAIAQTVQDQLQATVFAGDSDRWLAER